MVAQNKTVRQPKYCGSYTLKALLSVPPLFSRFHHLFIIYGSIPFPHGFLTVPYPFFWGKVDLKAFKTCVIKAFTKYIPRLSWTVVPGSGSKLWLPLKMVSRPVPNRQVTGRVGLSRFFCWAWVGNLNNVVFWIPNKDAEKAPQWRPKERLRTSKGPCCEGQGQCPASGFHSSPEGSPHRQNWDPTISTMNWQIQSSWRMRRPGRLRFPVLNRAFWNGKTKNYGGEMPNPNPAEGRGGPAGWGCQCLTLLSEMSRRKPKLRWGWGWRNTGFETPYPHAVEGRGGPVG